MNINDEQIKALQAMSQRSGVELTRTEIEEIAANFDDKAYRKDREEFFETVLWDKESPINGVPAEEVLAAREDIPEGGEVYLIRERESGRVHFFQPHVAEAEGLEKITKKNWHGNAKKHLDQVIDANVSAAFGNTVQQKIAEKRGK